MGYYEKVLHNYFIPHHLTENTVANRINAAHARRTMKSFDGILWNMQRLFLYSDWLYFLWHGTVKYNKFKMVSVFIYLFTFLLLAFRCYIDAMAYRGDLIGCTILFKRETNGKVPVVFTLNGRRITEDKIEIDYTPWGELLYPYIGMAHQGIRVLAKVCTIDLVYYEQFV